MFPLNTLLKIGLFARFLHRFGYSPKAKQGKNWKGGVQHCSTSY